MSNDIEVVSAEPLSPHNEALYEAGKALLIGSVDVGRDFCKSMIPVATGAIPIYLALIGLVVGKEFRPNLHQGVVLTLAPGAFLLATGAFTFGYFPSGTTFSLDLPDEIEAVRTATLTRRKRWASIGVGLLVAGVILSICGIYYGLSLVPAHGGKGPSEGISRSDRVISVSCRTSADAGKMRQVCTYVIRGGQHFQCAGPYRLAYVIQALEHRKRCHAVAGPAKPAK